MITILAPRGICIAVTQVFGHLCCFAVCLMSDGTSCLKLTFVCYQIHQVELLRQISGILTDKQYKSFNSFI